MGPATPQAIDTMRLPAGLVSEPQTSSSSARPALPTRTRTPYLSLPHSQDAAGRGRAHGLRLALESHGRNTDPDGTCSESPVPPTTVPLHSRFPGRAPPHQPGGQLGLRPGPLTRVPSAHLMHSEQTRQTTPTENRPHSLRPHLTAEDGAVESTSPSQHYPDSHTSRSRGTSAPRPRPPALHPPHTWAGSSLLRGCPGHPGVYHSTQPHPPAQGVSRHGQASLGNSLAHTRSHRALGQRPFPIVTITGQGWGWSWLGVTGSLKPLAQITRR